MKSIALYITCEHATNEIPRQYENLFEGHRQILESHRGWDIGAAKMARYLAMRFNILPAWRRRIKYAPGETSRLLIELNRSEDSAELYSEFTRDLSRPEKEKLFKEIYLPFRRPIEEDMQDAVSKGARVLHLSIHSFTPVLNGEIRKTDLGLLFDPARKWETEFCEQWKQGLDKALKTWLIEFNKPYKGTDDGFTRHLRTLFADEDYAGIELEINQKHYEGSQEISFTDRRQIFEAALGAMEEFDGPEPEFEWQW